MAQPLAHPETVPLDHVEHAHFELHVFELAYLMALLKVETVAALPDAVLFPQDPKVRSKVMAEGEKGLVARGLLTLNANSTGVPTAESTSLEESQYNEALLSMAAAIGDPRFTILTRRETRGEKRADASIYFSDTEVVEVTQIDRQVFRLRRLSDAPEAFQQVRKMLGVPARPLYAGGLAELRINDFQLVRKQVADGLSDLAADRMEQAGLSADAAADLVLALGAPQRKGVVSILKHSAQKVTDVRVLGFYFLESSAWLTSVGDERAQQVLVEAVDIDGFLRRLVERVANVCS